MAALERIAPAPLIRTATADDADAIADLGVAAGMFPPDARGFLQDMVETYAATGASQGQGMLIAGEAPLGMVYWRPEDATDGTYDLTMIAVAPEAQRTGLGRQLMARAETAVSAQGGRLMMVKTSAGPDYDAARAFYDANGYARVAEIADYWAAGDDLILFRKAL